MDYRIQGDDPAFLVNDVTGERLELAADQFAHNSAHLRDQAAFVEAVEQCNSAVAVIRLTSANTIQIEGDANDLYRLAREFESLM
jgi:hypothetical protein